MKLNMITQYLDLLSDNDDKFVLVCSEDKCVLFSQPVMYLFNGFTDEDIRWVDFDKTIEIIYRALKMKIPEHIDIKIEGVELE